MWHARHGVFGTRDQVGGQAQGHSAEWGGNAIRALRRWTDTLTFESYASIVQ
jgi:hypothetical protein